MSTNEFLVSGCLSVLLFISGCAGFQVGQQVQAGRNALQTGRPDDAVAYLRAAAELDPKYRIPYTLRESVGALLGRAYYEVGNYAEARRVLEKSLANDKEDHLARLYLGLTLLQSGDQQTGRREAEAGLKGIYDWLQQIAATPSFGIYWDPGRQIRSEIQRALNEKAATADFTTIARWVGAKLDEEIDKARRDEGRDRYDRLSEGA